MKIDDLDIDGLDIFKGKRNIGTFCLTIPTLPPIYNHGPVGNIWVCLQYEFPFIYIVIR